MSSGHESSAQTYDGSPDLQDRSTSESAERISYGAGSDIDQASEVCPNEDGELQPKNPREGAPLASIRKVELFKAPLDYYYAPSKHIARASKSAEPTTERMSASRFAHLTSRAEAHMVTLPDPHPPGKASAGDEISRRREGKVLPNPLGRFVRYYPSRLPANLSGGPASDRVLTSRFSHLTSRGEAHMVTLPDPHPSGKSWAGDGTSRRAGHPVEAEAEFKPATARLAVAETIVVFGTIYPYHMIAQPPPAAASRLRPAPTEPSAEEAQTRRDEAAKQLRFDKEVLDLERMLDDYGHFEHEYGDNSAVPATSGAPSSRGRTDGDIASDALKAIDYEPTPNRSRLYRERTLHDRRTDTRSPPRAASQFRDKGDILAVARVAGIQAAKQTSTLIPLCHNIPLSGVHVDMEPLAPQAHAPHGALSIRATARTHGQTGVEMEALVAATVAGLTVYDMCKSADRGMRLLETRLVEKRGGQSGDWCLNRDGVLSRI